MTSGTVYLSNEFALGTYQQKLEGNSYSLDKFIGGLDMRGEASKYYVAVGRLMEGYKS